MAERVFVLPDLGEGLEEARVVEWLVAPGDEVTLNQPLVEVETAKAAVEIPSPFAGRVVTLHGIEGSDVAVGDPLVTLDVAEEPARGTASLAAEERSPTQDRDGPLGPDGPAPPAPRPSAGAKATPPVRRLAKELGIDIDTVRGTGPDGRVTEADLRAPGASSTVPGSGSRRGIAETLSKQAAIPQVTTFRTVDCTELQSFRAELDVSPLPVVVAALCRTIDEHPILNAAWGGEAAIPRHEIHVGVATDTERGLVVPVVRDAGSRGISGLAAEIRRVAEAARTGALTPADLTGATVAVSNTGSYGSEAGTPILSPGTSTTLALGVIADRALVVDGAVVARPAATLSLTFDHRVMDGAAAGRALTDLVDRLQSAEGLRGLPR